MMLNMGLSILCATNSWGEMFEESQSRLYNEIYQKLEVHCPIDDQTFFKLVLNAVNKSMQ